MAEKQVKKRRRKQTRGRPRIVIRRTFEFSRRPGQKARAFYLGGIPIPLWDAARAKARKQRRSMRAVVLSLVRDWLNEDGGTALTDPDAPATTMPEPDPMPVEGEQIDQVENLSA